MVVPASPLEPTELRERFDRVLLGFLGTQRDEVAELAPAATGAVDQIARLIRAGGKRLRPHLCYWGYRAAGGPDDGAIVRAASALELLHTMALIHDDLIDDADRRRGVATVHAHAAASTGSPERGRAAALLAGDLAAVFADQLLLRSGFPAEALARALDHYHHMRVTMAAGQWLELSGVAPVDADAILRRSWLRGGAYTVDGPLRIGAALADGSADLVGLLTRFGEPLGQAFQLRDDLEDGNAAPGIGPGAVNDLVDDAIAALDPGVLPRGPRDALVGIASQVAMR